MSVKEFNLSKKRKELFDKANKEAESNGERASIVSIFTFIHNQDKEFIKRLKEILYLKPMDKKDFHRELDKLAGENLI